MRKPHTALCRLLTLGWLVLGLLAPTRDAVSAKPPPITWTSLLAEMSDPEALARFPRPVYQSLQTSSYNRESVHRDQPGWFADSDGLGFLRTETVADRTEWVILEHEGPGVITRIWTPYFYHDLNERVGPNVRIYLDGSVTPAFDESLIHLVTGRGSVPPPFATYTARAGDCYLPIPFATRCKITLTAKPFYHLINYRAYPRGTRVESLPAGFRDGAAASLTRAAEQLLARPKPISAEAYTALALPARGESRIRLPYGPAAVRQFTLRLPDLAQRPELLRSLVVTMSFDDRETVWCPVGDFFSCPDALHPYHTWSRTVAEDGTFTCRWVMPYRGKAEVRLVNLTTRPTAMLWHLETQPWTWDRRSMHFYARWRPDDIVPGTPFRDWNFIDVRGRGIYVGDAWTVLNPQSNTWWGEGDEKIYVDDAWRRGFPTHFGTGTEDYYGWAGGLVPTREDEFSTPFLANVRVGGLDGTTLGYNICTRIRSLDAIPFHRRLRFDMESSFGTDIRHPWNLLGYSAVTFWYAPPGAKHNRPARPTEASRPIHGLNDLQRLSERIRLGQ